MVSADALKRARASRQMTQTDLARASGVSGAMISMIEAGKRTPRLEVLEQIAAALGVGVADLIVTGGPGDNPTA